MMPHALRLLTAGVIGVSITLVPAARDVESSQQTGQQRPTGAISGVVVDAVTALPLAGARVSLSRTDDRSGAQQVKLTILPGETKAQDLRLGGR